MLVVHVLLEPVPVLEEHPALAQEAQQDVGGGGSHHHYHCDLLLKSSLRLEFLSISRKRGGAESSNKFYFKNVLKIQIIILLMIPTRKYCDID